VYKGEREKYWYLSCTRKRPDIVNPCPGTRIRYVDLLELVRQDLNSFIAMTREQQDGLVKEIIDGSENETQTKEHKRRIEKAQIRIATIDKILIKLYSDNAEGKIDDERLTGMVRELSNEAEGLHNVVAKLTKKTNATKDVADNYGKFFRLVKQHSHIEVLNRDTLLTFVEKIEIGEKILPDGYKKLTHPNTTPFQQEVKIYYRFIGELLTENSTITLPLAVNQ